MEPFILLLPPKSTPSLLGFYSLLLSYPIQPVIPSFSFSLYFIPSPCLTRSRSLPAGANPHSCSGSYAIFLDFSSQAQFSCSLNSDCFLLLSPGWKQEEQRAVSVQLCHNLFFTLAKSSQNTGGTTTFSAGGQFLSGAAKGMSPRPWQMLNPCSETQQQHRFPKKLSRDITEPFKECIYPFLWRKA